MQNYWSIFERIHMPNIESYQFMRRKKTLENERYIPEIDEFVLIIDRDKDRRH